MEAVNPKEVVDTYTACEHLREGLKATKAQRDADTGRLYEAQQRHGFEKVPWGEAFNQADKDSRDLAEAMCDMDWAASTATWLSRSDGMDSYEKDQLGIIHRMCVDANKTMERVRKSLNFYLSNYIFLSKPESSSTNPETTTSNQGELTMETKPYICRDGSEIKDRPMDLTKAQDLAGIGYFMGDDLQDCLPRIEGSGCIIMEGPKEYDVSEFEGLGFLGIKHKLLKDLDIVRRLEEEKARSGYEYGVCGVAPYLFQDGDDPKKFRLFIRIYAMRIGKPVTKEN